MSWYNNSKDNKLVGKQEVLYMCTRREGLFNVRYVKVDYLRWKYVKSYMWHKWVDRNVNWLVQGKIKVYSANVRYTNIHPLESAYVSSGLWNQRID